MSEIVLETSHLVRRFGAFLATNDVSLKVERGARHALIGPNGAGKTTLINLLTGVLPPSEGQVFLEGEDITSMASFRRVKRGLTRTFQINQLFNEFTPLETVALAIAEREGVGHNLWRSIAGYGKVVDEAAALLARFGLASVMGERTVILPYGKQRLLEIALAFASKPRVLLLDEPAAGVPEDERHEVLQIVSDLPADVTVLLIEHDMDLVFSFANRISVLVAGAVFVEGTVAEISTDPRVKAVYLGENA
ncbi:Branched-chain amino acid ABC transporter, ATP-binding protein [Neorhizobium galegae bv. officinalis]|uniref:Branched-chain amino acid ABC transporter, ATP-binding protein n=1 Tax=Neorhizobium galegae bv. officinalis TaxID=323656 RepID=A0A0T7FDZ9_NEOGA|nr:ABC transporter ATP-binding protein [Neorhizobium galegae]CDZ33234.1 Branched-chain amino acid ABC transporter, ATP-binding protein [Neorhizobium galegae bv. officinalis]